VNWLVFSVVFPQRLVDREAKLLRGKLQNIFRMLQQGFIMLPKCYSLGETVFAESFNRAKIVVEDHFNRYGLAYNSMVSQSVLLESVFVNALLAWQRVCKDFVDSSQNGSLHLMVRQSAVKNDVGHWSVVVDTALAGTVGYWLSQQGLFKRVNMLAEDFTYNTVNTAMLDAAVTLNASMVQWETVEDERVCDVCESYGSGGDGHGFYRFGAVDMPTPPPVHPNCRCRFRVFFQ